MVAMKSALIVTLFTFLRLGIPLLTMLVIGEAVHRYDRKIHHGRGA
jgi:hypothetical protein